MKLSILLFVFSLVTLPVSSEAGIGLLSPKEIRTLIGNYPAKNSPEEARDDEILLKLQTSRTKADCDKAGSQSNLHLESVFTKPVGPLEKNEFRSAWFSVMKLSAKTGANILLAKSLYDRPRPYLRNPNIKPCIELERSSSYPSGHSAAGRAVGRYLADRFPEKAEDIMAVANQVGKNRMIGGVHHPSDVEAGQKLGDEMAFRAIWERD
jgi:acid phosphatase (class A)